MNAMLRSVSFSAILSSEKHPPAAGGNKYRDPQTYVCREWEIGTLYAKWEVSIKSLPSELREPLRKRTRMSMRARGVGGWQENTGPLNQHEAGLTETGVVCTVLAQGCTRPSEYTSWLPVACFMGFLSVPVSGPLIRLPSLELFSFWLLVLSN